MTNSRPPTPDPRPPIKVLVVEDSAVVREFLAHILSSDPEVRVIGTAADGEEAVEAVKLRKPDVITMDVNMPRMDGFTTTRMIMETDPTPIVIVSASWNPDEVEKTFRAMEAGAVAVIAKPKGLGHPDCERTTKELIQTVKLMSEVRVVKRWSQKRREEMRRMTPSLTGTGIRQGPEAFRIVAIGASTGGPPVLQTILSGLSADLSVPLLIVQHMAPGFIQGMIDWLSRTSVLPIHIAARGEDPLPGHVYFAPEHLHMGVNQSGRIMLSNEDPENGLRPSVSYLFRSVAQVYGRNAIGVLLTGMGKDGAEELRLLKENGAITIAQDHETSVVHGMPGEAIRIKATTYVLPADRIAPVLEGLVNTSQGTRPSAGVVPLSGNKGVVYE